MYLLYAPREKFGLIPSGQSVVTDEVKFYQNVAFCPKHYWYRVHILQGCRDITPRLFKKLRQKRKLRSIVIFGKGGIGDTMWLMPFARALKEKHPQATILVITDKQGAEIWKYAPYINGAVEDVFWNLTGLFRRADEVYEFGGMATFLKKEMKKNPIDATFDMVGFPKPREAEKMRPKLVVTIDEGKQAEKVLKDRGIEVKEDKIISIGISASTANRNWPFEYIKELTTAFIDGGYKVLWLGKGKEREEKFLDEDIKKLGAINLVGRTSIRQGMAMLALSDLFIGPDSGLLNMAASLNIPSIGIYGPISPRVRANYFERHFSLFAGIKCQPCKEHWTECRLGYPSPCMKAITPRMAYKHSIDLLTRYPREIIGKLPID